jgi:hypothetical protein
MGIYFFASSPTKNTEKGNHMGVQFNAQLFRRPALRKQSLAFDSNDHFTQTVFLFHYTLILRISQRISCGVFVPKLVGEFWNLLKGGDRPSQLQPLECSTPSQHQAG